MNKRIISCLLSCLCCLSATAYGLGNEKPKSPAFAVIYRTYVKPGYEDIYLENWKIVATYFLQERGALGSTLHKSDDGMWVAYSRWPDKATRDASWPGDQQSINSSISPVVQQAIINLKSCFDMDRRLPEICMEVVEEASSDIN